MADAKWYVVHTYSGYENKVKANIEKSIENLGFQDFIFEVSGGRKHEEPADFSRRT